MPGYRLEYASSNRAKCKGPKPCAGTTLTKGCLRFGSTVEFQGKQSFAWRHWGCITPKVLSNVKDEHPDASDVDGFEELRPEDQEKVIKAWEVGKVADEDIPETARKADGDGDEEEDEKPKKKARAPKKKADDDGEEKPKKPRAAKTKKVEDDGEGDGDNEPKKPARKPRAKKAAEDDDKPKAKKAAPKKRSTKKVCSLLSSWVKLPCQSCHHRSRAQTRVKTSPKMSPKWITVMMTGRKKRKNLLLRRKQLKNLLSLRRRKRHRRRSVLQNLNL
ncbi:hypothetical protein J3R30DRAFT_1037186 [Lentinula aciculospora]|uniref:PARP-type domain-containing protein n=1 Tax=Lentinula aciculospora TaxID=153920 RepID=A0A9W9A3H8_9AGAR|nr:hypothetical protein J3R30DRAFT_1037186 [Lentinula aciculospora]